MHLPPENDNETKVSNLELRFGEGDEAPSFPFDEGDQCGEFRVPLVHPPECIADHGRTL
jgi:hypothetical protein